MADIWVILEDVGGEALEGGVEVGDAVLCEEADEVESLEWVLARRGREDGGVVCVIGLELGEEAVKGGEVSCAYGVEGADFEDFAWGKVVSLFDLGMGTKLKAGAYGP